MKFTKTTSFLGRNGCFKATGLELSTAGSKSVILEPVTSKDEIGRCFIEIPREDILDLIAELEKLAPPVCKRCGNDLKRGRCTDVTCPFSDHPQSVNEADLYEPKQVS